MACVQTAALCIILNGSVTHLENHHKSLLFKISAENFV